MNPGRYVYIIADEKRNQFEPEISKQVLVESWKCKAGLHSANRKLGSNAMIVYYEYVQSISEAIQKVKELKQLSNNHIANLIQKFNPGMNDIYYDIWFSD